MNSLMKYFLTSLFLFSCLGCWNWSLTGGKFSRSSYGYSVKTPKSWYQRNAKKIFQLTRDGCELDCITMKKWRWGDTLSSKKLRLSKDLLLHEIPRLFLADVAELDLKIHAEDIIMLDNSACTKTVYSFRRNAAVIEKAILICAPRRNHLITMFYQGTDRHYFEARQEDFEMMLQSLTFKGK